MMNHSTTEMPSPQTVLDAVSTEYNISVDDILGRSRLKSIVLARQMAAYILRYICRLESTKIAEIMQRFYTTVDFSIYQVEDMLRFDPIVQLHFKNLSDKLMPKSSKR